MTFVCFEQQGVKSITDLSLKDRAMTEIVARTFVLWQFEITDSQVLALTTKWCCVFENFDL